MSSRMTLGARPPFSAACNGPGCGERRALTGRTFDAAREELLAAGWVERHRKGGARKSQWSCPRCGAPAAPTRPMYATTARGVEEPTPLPMLSTVVMR